MAIPVQHEGKEWRPWESERCCFCRDLTPYWTLDGGKVTGASVACCKTCAVKHEPAQLPTKREWIERENAIFRAARR
jgi:hypothetical protein